MRVFLVTILLVASALSAPARAATEQDPALRDTVARVESYLNGISTLKERFVQVSSDGGFAKGELYIDRPGHLRFDYDPPTPVLLIADGTWLVYYDKELKEITHMPLWENPIWFLVRKRVRLDDGIEILRVERTDTVVSLTLRQREDPDAGVIKLIFDREPMALRRWELTDAQGITIQVALVDTDFGVDLDPKLFDASSLEASDDSYRELLR